MTQSARSSLLVMSLVTPLLTAVCFGEETGADRSGTLVQEETYRYWIPTGLQEKTGCAVLLLCAGSDTHALTRRLGRALDERSLCLVAPRRAKRASEAQEALDRTLETLSTRHGITPGSVVVLGQARGRTLARALIVAAPERFGGLILAGDPKAPREPVAAEPLAGRPVLHTSRRIAGALVGQVATWAAQQNTLSDNEKSADGRNDERAPPAPDTGAWVRIPPTPPASGKVPVLLVCESERGERILEILGPAADAAGVVIVAPAAIPDPGVAIRELEEALVELEREHGLVARTVIPFGFSRNGMLAYEVMRAAWSHCGGVAVAASLEQPDFSGVTAEGKGPALFLVHGTADTTVPVERTRRAAEAARTHGMRVTYHEIEGAGHMVVLERGATELFRWVSERAATAEE